VNRLPFIDSYFGAEKLESLLFIVVGALAIALALVLLRRRSSLRGMAIPLIAVALIQLVVGGTVYLRSDAQAAQLQQQAREAPAEFKRSETTRMKTVMANFELYRSIEIGLLALGMAIVVLLRNHEFWFAFGLGLVLQAGFMLALDHFAEARAHDYFKAVVGS
jgi:glucan phosphoethanolaminetransferase (alkaline phosphatase superfamily)